MPSPSSRSNGARAGRTTILSDADLEENSLLSPPSPNEVPPSPQESSPPSSTSWLFNKKVSGSPLLPSRRRRLWSGSARACDAVCSCCGLAASCIPSRITAPRALKALLVVATAVMLLVVVVTANFGLPGGIQRAASNLRAQIAVANMLPRACDQYALNGHLSNQTHLWQPYGLDYSSAGSDWSASSPNRGGCPGRVLAQPPTDHLKALSLAKSGGAWLPAHLSNRLVFVVGDSNDRHANIHMCDRVGGTHTVVDLDGSDPEEYSCRAHTHVCTVRDGSGAVFAWLTMFHLGVEMAAGRKNIFNSPSYCENGFPVDIRDRLQWVPTLLAGAAKKHFPEICARDGVPGCVPGSEQGGPLRRRDSTLDGEGNALKEAVESVEGESTAAVAGEAGAAEKEPTDGENNNSTAKGAEQPKAAAKPDPGPTVLTPAELEYFPIPDLVVAQSSIWDVREWRLYQDADTPWNDITATPGVLQTWLDKFVTLLVRPLRAVLDAGVQKQSLLARQARRSGSPAVPADGRVPLMLRTCPLPAIAHEQFPPHIVASQNEVVRGLAARASDERWRHSAASSASAVASLVLRQQKQPMLFRGVLDWAQLVLGVDSVQTDGYHQDNHGALAFAQMVMSELELLDLEQGRAQARLS
ncbi:hypothetical protein HK405_005891 [Cladochytrium tenue]|nr:hypothetical protein HK405_005891 [Cladochytrium tenue]